MGHVTVLGETISAADARAGEVARILGLDLAAAAGVVA
jgi:hypothetical protein